MVLRNVSPASSDSYLSYLVGVFSSQWIYSIPDAVLLSYQGMNPSRSGVPSVARPGQCIGILDHPEGFFVILEQCRHVQAQYLALSIH